MAPRYPDPFARALSVRLSRRAALSGLATTGAASALAGLTSPVAARVRTADPVAGHPRLWLTAGDLPRLRGRATETNPIWQDGLLVLAEQLKTNMDAGHVPGEDSGGYDWEQYPTENYAEFFAFLSLVHPDTAAREDYAQRARTLLMHAIAEAAKGPAADQPFRDPVFATFNRSRWWGEGFPLTVDWIYGALSAEDKTAIREVFLRWVDDNLAASTTSNNHPEPVGLVNDPKLLADPVAVRWAGNNYFAAHMRNIGLMALAFDPADDPDGKLTGAVELATGAWLYMVDHLLRTDARGGMPTEGFEYSPQQLAYVVEFLLALHTAGRDDPAVLGPQVVLTGNPFWDEMLPAYLNSLSPVPVLVKDYEYLGPLYQPAWYGDGQNYWAPDFIALFGALGRYDDLTGNTDRLQALRWIQTNLAPGGAEQMVPQRIAEAEDTHDPIFYFLLFDPAALAPPDPHPGAPTSHFAPGIGRLLVRTGWEADATWFTYALGWIVVDHQHCDGNQFEFYRKGEWLTKERTGYGFNIGCSDYHNTLALENNRPAHDDPDDYRHIQWQRGSQWWGEPAGDPSILAMSIADDYVYALGDATNLYNSTYENADDVLHASRSIVWLKPDHIVVYDRAATQTDGRFKRFWLNLPAAATVDGNQATVTTASGQQLVVTTVLPADATITSEPAEPLEENGEPADGDPMQFRLRVEATGNPRETRFLHVLQGVDAGVSPDPVTFGESGGGTGTPYTWAVVAGTAVLFPIDLGEKISEVNYLVPAGTTRHLVTGLEPGGGYDVSTQANGADLVVTIHPGSAQHADDGGVLDVEVTG
ncbi:MAG TPA: hypothetical protein VH482_35555 [Thermomicrobiales bacterium]|jgi:hypothetical protein